MSAKVVAITGATSGIGRAAVQALTRDGHTVVLLVRDAERGRAVAEEIVRAAGDSGRAHVVACDLASFASVRGAAEELSERFERLDVLVNNAGLITQQRELTVDGNELTFQVNHLSHFLLTHLLLDRLEAAAPSLVVNVSSDAHLAAVFGIDLDDPQMERRWSPFGAYAASKLANIEFTYAAAQRWAPRGIASCAVHPGMADTGFGSDGWGAAGVIWRLLAPKLTAEKAADTVVWLAEHPDPASLNGGYFHRRRPRRSSGASRDVDAQRRLWRLSEELTAVAQVAS